MPGSLPEAAARNAASFVTNSLACGLTPHLTTAIGFRSLSKSNRMNRWFSDAGLPARIPSSGNVISGLPVTDERNFTNESWVENWTETRSIPTGNPNRRAQPNSFLIVRARFVCAGYRLKAAAAAGPLVGRRSSGRPCFLSKRISRKTELACPGSVRNSSVQRLAWGSGISLVGNECYRRQSGQELPLSKLADRRRR